MSARGRSRGGGSRTVTQRGAQTRTEIQMQTPEDVADDRVYLDVPFEEKDEAKKLGAKWDPDKKKWYIPAGKPTDPFAKWFPGGRGRKLNASTSGGGGGDPNDNGGSSSGTNRSRRGGGIRNSNSNNFSSSRAPLFRASEDSGRPVSDAEALRLARLARFGITSNGPSEAGGDSGNGEDEAEPMERDDHQEEGSDDDSDVSEDILRAPRRNPSVPGANNSKGKGKEIEESDDDSDVSENLLDMNRKRRR